MTITPYQAKYFAYELTRRIPSDSIQKFTSTLLDAQIDLNPHQVEAALFAFRSPLSNGAILADEVGLGKTIEAGLVISQRWAERKRKIKEMEKKRNELRLELFKSQDEIDIAKEDLISEIEKRLNQNIVLDQLFIIKWVII